MYTGSPMPDSTSNPTGDLCDLTACRLAELIRSRAVSAREVMRAHLARYERINPRVNAIVTCVADAALDAADAADAALAAGREVGPLHGLPVAHKDLFVTAGIRTTFGSRAFERHVPDETALIVERERRAGAITVGKTNTPELGAGSQTFNEVFGATRNPWDPSKTCGGSSGGAAVALATGMVPIADGSDFGGSLRNPASFCNVVGFRPSSGRVPRWPSAAPWFSFHIHGPMARTVGDAAPALRRHRRPRPAGAAVADRAPRRHERRPRARPRRASASPGRPTSTACRSSPRCWPSSRAAGRSSKTSGASPTRAPRTSTAPTRSSPPGGPGTSTSPSAPSWTAIPASSRTPWFGTSRPAAPSAVPTSPTPNAGRAALHRRLRAWFADHDFLATTVAQVAPFDVDQPYVTAIAGQTLPTYLDWMKSCYLVSATGLPAISVPCGFTPAGLRVGLQIVGRPYDDLGVLQLAHTFEQATDCRNRRPPIL